MPAEDKQVLYDELKATLARIAKDPTRQLSITPLFVNQVLESENEVGRKAAELHLASVIVLQKLIVGGLESLADNEKELLRRFVYVLPDTALYIPTIQYLRRQPPASRIKVRSKTLARQLLEAGLYAGIIIRDYRHAFIQAQKEAFDLSFDDIKPIGDIYRGGLRNNISAANVFWLEGTQEPNRYFEAMHNVLHRLEEYFEQYYPKFAKVYKRFVDGIDHEKDVLFGFNSLLKSIDDRKIWPVVFSNISEILLCMRRLQGGKLAYLFASQTFGGADYIVIDGRSIYGLGLISVKSGRRKSKRIGAANGALSHARTIKFSDNENIDQTARDLFVTINSLLSRRGYKEELIPESLETIRGLIDNLSDVQITPYQETVLEETEKFLRSIDFKTPKDEQQLRTLNRRAGELMFQFGIDYEATFENIIYTGGKIEVYEVKPEARRQRGLVDQFAPLVKGKESTVAWYYVNDYSEPPNIIVYDGAVIDRDGFEIVV